MRSKADWISLMTGPPIDQVPPAWYDADTHSTTKGIEGMVFASLLRWLSTQQGLMRLLKTPRVGVHS